MKYLFIIVSIFISSSFYGQLEMVGEFTSRVRFIYLDEGEPVIFLYNKNSENIQLYASDFSLISNFEIPITYDFATPYHVFFVSRTMFDCDPTNIEYMVSYAGSNTSQSFVKVIREDGTEIFDLPEHTFWNDEVFDTDPGLNKSIIEVEDGVLMNFYNQAVPNENADNVVYKTCGTIPGPVGLDTDEETSDESNNMNFSIYPNPSSTSINVDYKLLDDHLEGEINIFNDNGQLVHNKKIGVSMSYLKVNVREWPSGIYHVVVNSKSGGFISESFIKVNE